MSEDNQWRQLGSVVNGVLLETRAKAIRAGQMAPAKRPALPARAEQIANRLVAKPMGHGFLDTCERVTVRPAQLELPLGTTGLAAPLYRTPRGVRLM